jgi:hypothetical protein
MNSSALEERQEHEHAIAVAAALGISLADLQELDWTLEPHESDDGVLYGYNVYFGEDSDPETLSQIKGLNGGRWVRIGPNI